MLRDLALFAHSVYHSTVRGASRRDYWDHAQEQDLGRVVELLSHTDDPERFEIRRVLHELKPRTVLDAGCGPATEFEGYQRAGLPMTYTGIDGSERMLAMARRRYPSARLVRGALDAMPFGDRSFDVVLLKHVLEHQPDYRPVIREAVRLCRRAVVIDLFHRLLPLPFDVRLKDRRGFHNNWYARGRFEKFVQSLPLRDLEHVRTLGTAKQTAEIFVLKRDR
jgi:ubiquinone/menaquinone biosynthesis C-methylase UbiE